MSGEKKLYSVTEAARLAGKRESTLRHAIKVGALRATKIGWSWIVAEDDLQDWLDKPEFHRTGPKSKQ